MSNAERHLLSICMKLYRSTSGDYHVAALLIMTILLGSFLLNTNYIAHSPRLRLSGELKRTGSSPPVFRRGMFDGSPPTSVGKPGEVDTRDGQSPTVI